MDSFHWVKWIAKRSMTGKSFEIPLNVTLVSRGEIMYGNDIILKSHSKYLKYLLEKNEQVQPIQLYTEPEDLKILLKFISTGYLPNELISVSLLTSSSDLEMPEAVKMCVQYLEAIINEENALDLMISAYRTRQKKFAAKIWHFIMNNLEKMKIPNGFGSVKDFFIMARKPLIFASEDLFQMDELQSALTGSELSDNL